MNDMQTSLERYNKAVDTLIDALRKENKELREYKLRNEPKIEAAYAELEELREYKQIMDGLIMESFNRHQSKYAEPDRPFY